MDLQDESCQRAPDPRGGGPRDIGIRITEVGHAHALPATSSVADDGKGAVSAFKGKLTAAQVTKPVYGALVAHQLGEADWSLHCLHGVLDEWYDRLTRWAALDIPRTVLRLQQNLRRTCVGWFRPGHNEFGVRGEIAVAVPAIIGDHLEAAGLDLGDTIGTVLHEQLHLDQALHGAPSPHNHHNAEFRNKARRFGLIVDYRGHQTYQPGGPFLELLRQHGIPWPRSVTHPSAAGNQPPSSGGRSTLKKWACLCTNVWVGVAELRAVCRACGNPFVRA